MPESEHELLQKIREQGDELAILPTKAVVVFPSMVMPLMINDEKYARLIDQTLMKGRAIGLFAQKTPDEENPGPEGIYRVGTVGTILKMLRFPDGSVRFLVQGLSRVKITEIVRSEPFITARTELIEEQVKTTVEIEALVRHAHELIKQAVALSPNLSEDLQISAINTEEAGKLADLIASNLNLSTEKRQDILATFDIKTRLEKVLTQVKKEIEVLELSHKIQSEAATEMGRMQKEFILREQLKAIRRELGDSDDRTEELDEFKKKIAEAHMPELALKAAEKELDRLSKMNPSAAEYTVSRTYLDWLVCLPWDRKSRDILDINKALAILDEDHYDLEKVKERILEFLAVRKLKADLKGPILCFVGPPGVGKTSLGRSIARAMGRKFQRISLGGMRDEAEIRGHRRTYIGALPGRIIQGLRRAESNNPVFMLDEIDKIGQDFRGDPASALLEVLDPEQNNSFSDHYLDVPFDLSNVMFITTANLLHPIPAVLRDRMEVIEMPGYTDLEKVQIAKRYLVPRELENHGLKKRHILFSDAVLKRIIRDYTRESGLRNLDREVATICRKVARVVATGKKSAVVIKADKLHTYLGPVKFLPELIDRTAQIGVVPGLAWTSAGGSLLFVEVSSMPGKGNLTLTGSLGDVMKESVKAALTNIRSDYRRLGLDQEMFAKTDFHVHVPAGATPKDGPSAGITIATAIASLLTNRPVAPRLGMTGEITLHGQVLAIGGLKEKSLAAYRSGIKRVIIPKDNEKDLVEIPEEVRKNVEFIPVRRIKEVLDIALPGITKKSPGGKSPKDRTVRGPAKRT
jgi:ATP-dependent Lon protease